MGVYYYAVNKKNKTFFELGKGGWPELNYEKESFTYLEYLSLYILEDCFTYKEEEDTPKLKKWIDEDIAPILFDMMKGCNKSEIEIIPDNTDELTIIKAKKYKCIGSVYEHNNDLNEHLEDNDRNKRFYNLDGLKNLQYFNDY